MRAEATTCYRSQDGGILWRQRRSCRTLTYMQIFDIFATEHNELEQLRTGRHSAFSRLPIFSSVALHCEANQTCRSISSNQLAEKWIIKWTLMASHSMGKHQGNHEMYHFATQLWLPWDRSCTEFLHIECQSWRSGKCAPQYTAPQMEPPLLRFERAFWCTNTRPFFATSTLRRSQLVRLKADANRLLITNTVKYHADFRCSGSYRFLIKQRWCSCSAVVPECGIRSRKLQPPRVSAFRFIVLVDLVDPRCILILQSAWQSF